MVVTKIIIAGPSLREMTTGIGTVLSRLFMPWRTTTSKARRSTNISQTRLLLSTALLDPSRLVFRRSWKRVLCRRWKHLLRLARRSISIRTLEIQLASACSRSAIARKGGRRAPLRIYWTHPATWKSGPAPKRRSWSSKAIKSLAS